MTAAPMSCLPRNSLAAHVPDVVECDRSPLTKSLTLSAMSLGYAVVQLDVTIVNTALSSIGHSLGGGVSELQWVVTAYTIAFAALILTAGALGDRVDAKRSSCQDSQSSRWHRWAAHWRLRP